MFKIHTKEIQWGDKTLVLETGKIARQADGAVIAKLGNSVVLCTVVGAKKAKSGIDFFPLTVHYQDRRYAGGKFPGGFFKRENRPSEREVLTSRLIDRPIRPLFPENFHNEVQIICTTISYDPECNPDILAIIGSSAALAISGVPFEQPIGAARVGYKDGEYTLNPSIAQLADGSLLDLVVAGTKDAVLMVESTASQLSEEIMLGAVEFGHKSFQPIIKAIAELAKEVGNKAWDVELPDNSEIEKLVKAQGEAKIRKAYALVDKQERRSALDAIKEEIKKSLVEEKEMDEVTVGSCIKNLEKDVVRSHMLKTKKRIDGRSEEEIRNIVCELDLLPSVHGSALFTRGETQALVVTTLGTGDDEQVVDDIEGDRKDRFMLHYNFPPYSVGECGRLGAPGRREVGHGKLAFRAINPLIPTKEQFPYTIRVVSEITESNGSSSMASVCGASLSLMAAGVPLPAPIAGIAMGLIMEGKDYVVLSDIMGDEDHLGDMDFKVAGTSEGITALQMDIKISGITTKIMEQALTQAKAGRIHILGKMADALTASRTQISSNAPQINSFKIPKDKIGALIGPGGKKIKEIIEKTGVKIDISDDGTVNVASTSDEAMKAALEMVNDVIAVPEAGKVYHGTVTRIVDFGAFVAIMKDTEGLLHVSEMSASRVNHPRDILKEGDKVDVKVLSVEANGKLRLTLKFGEGFEGEAAPTSKAESTSGEQTAPAEERTERSERPRKPQGKFRNDKRGGSKGGDRNNKDRGPRHNDRNDRGNENNRGNSEESSQPKKRRFF